MKLSRTYICTCVRRRGEHTGFFTVNRSGRRMGAGIHEDSRSAAWSEIGDYLGIPLKMRRGCAPIAGCFAAGVPEHQCKPHPSDYGCATGDTRWWKTSIGYAADDCLAHAYLLAGATRTIWRTGVRIRRSSDAYLAGFRRQVGGRYAHHTPII